jgi:hypothetical protein
VTTAGTVTSKTGTITLTSAMVDVIENGVQVGIFGGTNGYVHVIGEGTVSAISDGDFPGASSATYQDGFGIVSRPSTAQFFKTALNDFTDWDALEFSTAGWKTDDLVRVFSDHRNVWLMGTESIEPWFNTGNATFPFSRREGTEMEIGLAAVQGVVAADNGVYWVSRSKLGEGMIMQSLGLQPKIISTTPIMESINSYADISDTIAFSYQFDGHIMVEFTFPTGGASWVYDSSTRLWHERQSGGGIHNIREAMYFGGKNLVAHISNGKIYELSRDAYDEDGTAMPATRISQVLLNNEDLITYNELHMLFSPGVGLASGAAGDVTPQAVLSWSDDGGHTFSSTINVPMGVNTAYDNRAIAYRLGQGRNRLFKVVVSAKVKRDLFDAFARIEIDEA